MCVCVNDRERESVDRQPPAFHLLRGRRFPLVLKFQKKRKQAKKLVMAIAAAVAAATAAKQNK